jgi:CRP-like cAMP-binding protein
MAERLTQRVGLTAAEAAFLDSLEDRTAKFRRRDIIQEVGEPSTFAFVLKSGWAITCSDFGDGSRQVRRLHFPGDLLGMPAMALCHHPATIEAVTDVVVAPFAKARLTELIGSFPRLAALMFVFAQEERITLGDRLCSLSRISCKGRLAFLLMDVLHRLRRTDPTIESSFHMHLSRAQMGEIAGMTPVHASRVWSELIAEQVISFEAGLLTIRDEPRLTSLSGFVDRSKDLDFQWLPASTR